MSTFDGKFISRLSEERKRLGLSQDSVADLCGVSRKQWGNYESGRNVPGGEVLFLFTKAGADILYLMTGSRLGADFLNLKVIPSYNRTEVDELVDVFAHTTDEGRLALLSLARHLKK